MMKEVSRSDTVLAVEDMMLIWRWPRSLWQPLARLKWDLQGGFFWARPYHCAANPGIAPTHVLSIFCNRFRLTSFRSESEMPKLRFAHPPPM